MNIYDTLKSISIPYGSIKARTDVVFSIPVQISIPYGSIKALVNMREKYRICHFNSLWFD